MNLVKTIHGNVCLKKPRNYEEENPLMFLLQCPQVICVTVYIHGLRYIRSLSPHILYHSEILYNLSIKFVETLNNDKENPLAISITKITKEGWQRRGGLFWPIYSHTRNFTTDAWARICKRSRSPEVDSKESIPPAMYPGGSVRQIGLSYQPARLDIDSWAP
jgi:hypothetical protein